MGTHGTVGYRGRTAASEIQFARAYDLGISGDLDGTAIPLGDPLRGPEDENFLAEGFYFQPGTTGDVEVLTYQDWHRQKGAKVIDDSLSQILPACAAGIWHAVRVIKIYAAGTVSTNIAVGI